MSAIIPPPPYPPVIGALPSPGASGNLLTSNGASWTSAAPPTPPDGFSMFNAAVPSNWGWAGAGSSATNITTAGVLAALTPTATDSTSNTGNGTAGVGLTCFYQNSSAVLNNTTVLSWISGASPSIPGFAGTSARPVWGYTFALGSAVGYFAVNFGKGAIAASSTATQDTNCCGISFLSGDTTFFAFGRNAGGTERIAFAGVAPVLSRLYTVVVDYSLWPTSVRVCLYDWTSATWVGDATLTANVPATGSQGRIAIYCQNSVGAAVSMEHYGIGYAPSDYPLSLP